MPLGITTSRGIPLVDHRAARCAAARRLRRHRSWRHHRHLHPPPPHGRRTGRHAHGIAARAQRPPVVATDGGCDAVRARGLVGGERPHKRADRRREGRPCCGEPCCDGRSTGGVGVGGGAGFGDRAERACSASHICAATRLTAATSAPGLHSLLPTSGRCRTDWHALASIRMFHPHAPACARHTPMASSICGLRTQADEPRAQKQPRTRASTRANALKHARKPAHSPQVPAALQSPALPRFLVGEPLSAAAAAAGWCVWPQRPAGCCICTASVIRCGRVQGHSCEYAVSATEYAVSTTCKGARRRLACDMRPSRGRPPAVMMPYRQSRDLAGW